MKMHIPLGRWLGIPVGLHYSWFIVAWLITLSLAARFSALHPAWVGPTVWALAAATALLFFVSLVLHELSHAVVARYSGVPVQGITLFALGGVARLERDAATPGREFSIAAAGPITSFAIGFLCLWLGRLAGWTPDTPAPSAAAAMLGWLGFINILLATFNLLPGFPLDGGRILRAIVWRISGNGDRATLIAARTGQAVAGLFILAGLFALVTRGNFGGLWIAFIGWFLMEAAQAQYAQTELAARLRGVRVADIMATDCAAVDARTPIQQFVDEQLLRASGRCFAVRQDARVVGVITPHELKSVDRSRWADTPILNAMRPLESMQTIRPDAPAEDALQMMGRSDVNQLPVVTDGRFRGVVTRSHLIDMLQLRSELRA
jgi:Zn-dependent protease/predicted transcriptional regulator